MIKNISISILFFIIAFASSINAQTVTSGIAILDLSVRNNESNDARIFSAEHMTKVAGVNYIVTEDLVEASSYSMIFCSSFINGSTFTDLEKNELINFVELGGTLLAPRVEDEDLFALFGISAFESDFSRFEINWETASPLEALEWLDQPEEYNISLGRTTYPEIFKTLGYTTSTGETLASFEDGMAAVTRNTFGNGQAVAIGLSLKDVIVRSQINRDYEAQRIASNGFEPSSDVFALFLRGLFAAHHPYAVWKHTSPGNSAATLMITHDVDSRTGMDTLEVFVDYEFEHNIEATYNVTLRYFEDALMTAYYLDRQETLDNILAKGHTFGSHSVGHFFDFADEDIFPVGSPGNTISNYAPYNDGDITTGGTIYGECEVSKNELESDIGVNIRSFRAGHLAFPKFLIDVLEELGYAYNSTVSASDVLTNFPFQNKMGRSFSGATSSIYEIPVTISDVFHADPISDANYLDKADIWTDVTLKNYDNGAPTVLLIHPNRNYKLAGMNQFLNQLPNDIHIMELSLFGDFWRAREAFSFDTQLQGDQLNIVIGSDENLDDNISFVVNDGQSLSSIIVKNELNEVLEFEQESWGDNDMLLYYTGVLSSVADLSSQTSTLHIYPSPTKGLLNIKFDLAESGKVQVDLFDLHGNKVAQLLNETKPAGVRQFAADLSTYNVSQGIYFVVLQMENGTVLRRKVLLM